ncbi:MAG: hypothetical protein D6694_07240 [Gammaproteobacteria bacterium]|nr:MAG: hypothetical protein D6694_07240 [Gammaproteobacteria bacterium]
MQTKFRLCLLLMLSALYLYGCQQLPNRKSTALPTADKPTNVWPEHAVRAFREANQLRQQNPSDALLKYQQCIKLAPTMEPCWFNYLKLASEHSTANTSVEKIYQQIVNAKVRSGRIENLWGVILVNKGEISKARSAFEKALALEPQSISATRNLAILLDLYLGETRKALALYEKLQKLLAAKGQSEPRLAGWIADLKNRM